VRRSQPAASGFRLVSATDPSGQQGAVVAAVAHEPAADFAPQARYEFDPSYSWLRGRLEYSQVDGRWKLRYIPVDGKTDQYGGSVVIADEAKLAGCERGDFVEVRGSVAGQDAESAFAPVYEVAELKRLDRAGS
jgi:hypothetical protein